MSEIPGIQDVQEIQDMPEIQGSKPERRWFRDGVAGVVAFGTLTLGACGIGEKAATSPEDTSHEPSIPGEVIPGPAGSADTDTETIPGQIDSTATGVDPTESAPTATEATPVSTPPTESAPTEVETSPDTPELAPGVLSFEDMTVEFEKMTLEKVQEMIDDRDIDQLAQWQAYLLYASVIDYSDEVNTGGNPADCRVSNVDTSSSFLNTDASKMDAQRLYCATEMWNIPSTRGINDEIELRTDPIDKNKARLAAAIIGGLQADNDSYMQLRLDEALNSIDKHGTIFVNDLSQEAQSAETIDIPDSGKITYVNGKEYDVRRISWIDEKTGLRKNSTIALVPVKPIQHVTDIAGYSGYEGMKSALDADGNVIAVVPEGIGSDNEVPLVVPKPIGDFWKTPPINQ